MCDYYVIVDPMDQCYCAKCGYHIKMGEKVFPTKNNDYLACSRQCRGELEEKEEYVYNHKRN